MKELKFHKDSEILRNTDAIQDSLFDGHYKFSTQSTVLHDAYCLLDLDEEIMRLNVACDRIFYRDGRIAILRGSTLDIYKDKIFEKSLDALGHENINDFLPNLEESINSISDNQWIFYSNTLMKVTDTAIEYDSKIYVNEIHEDGCRYFVAWKDDVAILGNNKSLSFMYFYRKLQIDAEEYSPLCPRMDEDTFDTIFVDDIKFSNGSLLMIDPDIISIYTIKDLDLSKDEIDKKTVDYVIKGSEIVQQPLLLKQAKTPVSSTGTFKRNAREDILDLQKSLSISKDSTKTSETNLIESLGSGQSQASIQEKDSKTKQTLPAVPRHNIIETEAKNEKNVPEKQNFPELEDFDKSFQSRINGLKSSIRSISQEQEKNSELKFIESNYDLSGLYNSIFHNEVEEYEKALSAMIVRLETLGSIDSNNIKESIRFFDSKIFENRSFKQPVSYSDPLCAKFGSIMKISNPVSDLIEGFKMVELQKSTQNRVKFEDSQIKPESGSNNSSLCTPSPKNPQTPSSSIFSEMKPVLPGSNAIIKESSAPITNPNTASQPSSFFYKQANMEIPKSQSTTNLFGSGNDISSPFKVADTSSLFNNLVSTPNGVRTDSIKSIPTDPSPATGNDPNQPASAFNRLAGSRRLFQ